MTGKRSLVAKLGDCTGLNSGDLRGRTLITVFLAYGVLAILLTYPVATGFFSKAAGSTDVYEYMWELWWAKRSLIDLHVSPAQVTSLYYPYGAQHPLLLLDAYLMLTSLPVVLLFNPATAINLHLLSSYALTGLTTYLLVYYLTRRHWAAFIGGAIFAFSPFRSDRAAHGVISMALTYWLPLYVLFLLRLFRRPSRINAAMTGIALGFSILSSFLHLAHFVVPFTAVLFGYEWFTNRRRLWSMTLWKHFGLAGGLAGLMVLLPYWPLLSARISGQLDYFGRFGILGHSAALLSFFMPPRFHILVRQVEPLTSFVQNLLTGRYYVVYLGLVTLLLAGLSLLTSRARLWIWVALVSGVLALGPLLHVTRDLVEITVSDRTGFVVLPGALLTGLPFYEWARGPARFAELTIFAVAIMASYGVTQLRHLARPMLANTVAPCSLLALLLVDYAIFLPFPTQSLPVPGFYHGLQSEQDEYGILDIGTERFNHEGMYFQTVHQNPIARGFIYRYPSGSHYYQEFLNQLMNPDGDIVNIAGPVPRLQQLGLGLVVLHRLPGADFDAMEAFLRQNLGPPIYEDTQISAYRVAQASSTPVTGSPLLLVGEQWHPLELADGAPSRWMVNDGVIYAMTDIEGSYRLHFTVYPFSGPRHLEVYVAERPLETYDVGTTQSYQTPAFELAAGEWTPIRFHVPEGCQVPEGGEDQRCLSVLFQAVDISQSELGG